MRMPKGKTLISAALLASALLAGCGSNNNNLIPAVVTIFDAHNGVFRNLTTLVTSGNNSFGQLGFDFGNLNDQAVYQPIAGGIVTFKNNSTGHGNVGVAVGAAHTIAFGAPANPAFGNATTSLAYAWGSNYHGQLGNGTIPITGTNAYSRVPILVGANTADKNGTLLNVPMSGVIAVSAGGFHSLALTKENNGTVYSWGYNGYSELGTGNQLDRIWPGFVLLQAGDVPLTGVKAIAAGADHSLALSNDGFVFAWGDNMYGQCGKDSTNPNFLRVNNPELVQTADATPLNNITQIAAGGTFSIALQETNGVQNLYFWGNNITRPDVSLISLSTPIPVFLPGIVDATHQILKIAAGLDHIVILVADGPGSKTGTVYAIGFNQTGQLGDTTIVSRPLGLLHTNPFSNLTTAAASANTWANFTTATHGSTRSALVPTVKSAAEVKAAGQWAADDISVFGQSTMVHVPGYGWYGWGDNSHGQLGNPVPTTSIGYLLSASFAQGTQDKQ